jgi:hypothetical protein
MAKGIVDVFEAIEIQKQQRHQTTPDGTTKMEISCFFWHLAGAGVVVAGPKKRRREAELALWSSESI